MEGFCEIGVAKSDILGRRLNVKKRLVVMLLVLAFALLTLISACADSSLKIKIGSKNFTESLILGEMYALALEDSGFEVERNLNLAGTFAAHEALKNGDIDLYPEYTATSLFNIMGVEPQIDSQEIFEIVSAYYEEEFDLIWLAPSQVNRSPAIVMSRKVLDEYGISTLTDLQKHADKIDFASVPEFEERKDGLAGMIEVYGEFNFKSIKLLDYGEIYRAVLSDEVQGTVGFGTDGELTNPEWVLLEDDQFLWPPYLVAPVIRHEALDQDLKIGEILDKISTQLDTETMRALNAEVDLNQRDYADVAEEFLKEKGLIQ